jgi:aspartate carbamoyltransferase regulatory subunit
MIKEILESWQENSATMTKESKPSCKCKYCDKEFRKENVGGNKRKK